MGGATRQPLFWVSEPDSDEKTLTDHCRKTAGMIDLNVKDPPARSARGISHFLFSLSRRSLPDVRWNRYWPEVARELNRRAQASIDDGKIINFFRTVLDSAYEEEIHRLEAQGIYHKYVALVFEQAGIGKDRNTVIKEFLVVLVRLAASSFGQVDPSAVVRNALDAFIAEAKVSKQGYVGDIAPLSGVLSDIGRAVLDFRQFVNSLPSRWDLATSPWEDISKMWKVGSGIDPETLTPSAREVLLDIVQQLASVITRAEAFRAIRNSKLNLKFPKYFDIGQISRWSALPLGLAEMLGPAGTRVVTVVDDADYTPEKLVAMSVDTWHSTGDNLYFRVSDTPFNEITPTGREVPAVPIYVGSTLASAQRVGYYWGFEFPACEAPEDKRNTNRLDIDYRIRISPQGVALRVRRFSLSGGMDLADASLSIGNNTIWHGDVETGCPVEWNDKTALVTASSQKRGSVTFVLASERGESYERQKSLELLRQPVIFVCASKPIRPHTTFPLDTSSEQVIDNLYLYARDGEECEVHGAKVQRIGKIDLAGYEFIKFKLVINKDQVETITVGAWGREWRLAPFTPFVVAVSSPDQICLDNVTIRGTEGVRPVAGNKYPLLSVISTVQSKHALRFFRLHIKSDESMSFPIGEDDWTHEGEAWILALDSYLGRLGIDLPEITSELGIGAWDNPPDQWFTFVKFYCPPQILATRVGAKSILSFGSSDRPRVVKSDTPVTLVTLNEGKFVNGRVELSNGQLWFSWMPVIRDATIGSKIGTDCGYFAAFHDFADGSPMLKVYGHEDSRWVVRGSGNEFELLADGRVDLTPLLWQMRILDSIGGTITIEAVCDGDVIAWNVLDQFSVSDVKCSWMGRDNSVAARLRVEAKLRGFFPEDFAVLVRHAGFSIGEKQVAVISKGVATAVIIADVEVMASTIDGHGMDDVVVEIACRGTVIHSMIVGGAAPRPTVGDPKNDIKAALNGFRNNGNLRFAEVALKNILTYAAIYRSLPYPLAQLLGPVMNANVSKNSVDVALLQGCIRLTVELLSENPGVPGRLSFKGHSSDLLCLMGTSLVIFQQDRLGGLGLLEPALLQEASDTLALLEDRVLGGAWNEWCKTVRAFAGDVLIEHSSRAGPERTMVEPALALAIDVVSHEALSSLHPRFKDWINRLCQRSLE